MKVPAWLKSALTTFVVVAGVLLAVSAQSDAVTWSAGTIAALTTAFTVGRTALAAINPATKDFGWTQLAGLLPAWVVSLVNSLAAFAALAGVVIGAGLVSVPGSIAVWVTVGMAVIRTLAAALNPSDPSFGVSAPELPGPGYDIGGGE